jgi:hypothetical protein
MAPSVTPTKTKTIFLKAHHGMFVGPLLIFQRRFGFERRRGLCTKLLYQAGCVTANHWKTETWA